MDSDTADHAGQAEMHVATRTIRAHPPILFETSMFFTHRVESGLHEHNTWTDEWMAIRFRCFAIEFEDFCIRRGEEV